MRAISAWTYEERVTSRGSQTEGRPTEVIVKPSPGETVLDSLDRVRHGS
jgi:hypothetical protein